MNTQAQTPTIVNSDSLGLVELWHSTNGPNWTPHTGDWVYVGGNSANESRNANTWGGVGINNLRLDELVIVGFNLDGSLPPDLGLLTEPRKIRISSNPLLVGPIPTEVGTLGTLVQLNLSENGLVGPLPNSLSGLGNLTHLRLNSNNITGPIFDDLDQLTQLQVLDLSWNQIDGSIPDAVTSLVNLKELVLHFNNLSGEIPYFIGDLDNLEWLALNQNQLEGEIPPSLGSLPELTILNIGQNRLKGPIPSTIGGLVKLKSFLAATNDLNGPIPQGFGLMKDLELLNLTFNEISGAVPNDILLASKLSQVFLNENDIDAIPDFSVLQNLFVLRIEGNKLNFDDLDPLQGLVKKQGVIFRYAPQDNIPIDVERIGDVVTLHARAGGADSVCKWFRDDIEILGATELSYTLPDPEDTGFFKCVATNPKFEELTLETNPVQPSDSPLIVVNSEKDTKRDDKADPGLCTTGDEILRGLLFEPECTLRAAIQTLNTLSQGKGGQTSTARIFFDVPGKINVTIAPATFLPPLRRPVLLDGFTQPGAGITRITGENIEQEENGLVVLGSGSTVRGLLVDQFKVGISVEHSNGSLIEKNSVASNRSGVGILEGTDNVISEVVAVENVSGISVILGSGNQILSSYIGVEDNKRSIRENMSGINLINAQETTISNNVISGNQTDGVKIASAVFGVQSSSDNRLENNWIGTTPESIPVVDVIAYGNRTGVRVEGISPGTIVRGNTISNNVTGVLAAADEIQIIDNRIGTSSDGIVAEANTSTAVQITSKGVRVSGNTISGNGGSGIDINAGATNTEITGNFIGTDSDGLAAIPNKFHGIDARDLLDSKIENNVISGNDKDGLRIFGKARSSSNDISSNKIGTDVTGFVAIGNGGIGLRLNNSSVRDVRNNVISANSGGGILIEGDWEDMEIYFNHVGTTIDGGIDQSFAIPNKSHGIVLDGGSGVSLTANTISYNAGNGIRLLDTGTIRVIGNYFAENQQSGLFGRNSQSIVTGNEGIKNDDGTAIHWESGHVVISGNELREDSGDGITLEAGATAIVEQNNIYGNAGFGLNNENGSEITPATGNWWGNVTGPSGQGPGSGDAVSPNVDFSNWLLTPVSVVVQSSIEEVLIPVGEIDSLLIFAQNFSSPGDILDLSVSDTRGWYSDQDPLEIQLNSSDGAAIHLPIHVPIGIPDGTTSRIQISAISQANTDDSDTTSATLVAGIIKLAEVIVTPENREIMPSDTLQFSAQGIDQFGRSIDVNVNWSASAGQISSSGLFVASLSAEVVTVTATHATTGISESVNVFSGVPIATQEKTDIPTTFVLGQNYPNPFNPTTAIEYLVPTAEQIGLVLYDVLGRRVRVLTNDFHNPGLYRIQLDASTLSSGIYFYRMTAGNFTATRKMLLLK